MLRKKILFLLMIAIMAFVVDISEVNFHDQLQLNIYPAVSLKMYPQRSLTGCSVVQKHFSKSHISVEFAEQQRIRFSRREIILQKRSRWKFLVHQCLIPTVQTAALYAEIR